jgi:Zn-dependent protease
VISLAMLPTRQGSFHLFRLFGIDVFLHWSWFLIALYEIQARNGNYHSYVWNVLEYLALFLIVLMHEFGHALACRSVGGKADQIVLWPLGGVAYVSPPQRPGAMLWSIAAGPLVNVVLFPLLSIVVWLSSHLGWVDTAPDVDRFLLTIWYINLLLLGFNLLPIYPLDGGQIVRSLLWFIFGSARSLMIAAVLGFVAVAALIPFVIRAQFWWYYVLVAFVLMNCWRGFQQARAMAQLEKAPRHNEFACPVCKASPRIGEFWLCGNCRKPFDLFATQSQCPHCGAQYAVATCQECGNARAMNEWVVNSPMPPKI